MKRLLLLSPLLLLSGIALAAGGGAAHGPVTVPDADTYMKIGVHAVQFLIMYGLIFFLLSKYAKPLLKVRAETIRQDLEESNSRRKSAQDRFDELEQRLARFDAQVDEMRAEARTLAEREAELIDEKTTRDIKLIKDTTERAIREETRKARASLQAEAVDLALGVAEERIRKTLSKDDQKRLAGEFLAAVKDDNHV